MNQKIDICIITAGGGKLTPIFDSDEDNVFESIVQTNLIGTWYVTKEVANHMRNHNVEGSIITVSSINGANKLRENLTAYCAAKAGVIQLTKALVRELSKFNIRINCIVPGLFYTPLTHNRLSTLEDRKKMEDIIPLGFVAEPSDLDGLILYLASNKASAYVTGSSITIDGGLSWGGSILLK